MTTWHQRHRKSTRNFRRFTGVRLLVEVLEDRTAPAETPRGRPSRPRPSGGGGGRRKRGPPPPLYSAGMRARCQEAAVILDHRRRQRPPSLLASPTPPG